MELPLLQPTQTRFDVAIILPSIRPKNLVKFWNAAKAACSKYTVQLVVISPYKLPEELVVHDDSVVYLHSYANPTLCFVLGTKLANAEYLYNCTDDGLIQPEAIDKAVDIHRTILGDDLGMVNMIYEEGVLDAETLVPLTHHNSYHPIQYWYAHYHGDLRLPGIEPHWKICPHFFIKKKYYEILGGVECIFEYINHGLHDLAFRVQADGGRIIDLPFVAYRCSHLPGKSGDHGPIVDAQTGPDLQNFNRIYFEPRAAYKRIQLNPDAWKAYPMIWTRRFDPNNLP